MLKYPPGNVSSADRFKQQMGGSAAGPRKGRRPVVLSARGMRAPVSRPLKINLPLPQHLRAGQVRKCNTPDPVRYPCPLPRGLSLHARELSFPPCCQPEEKYAQQRDRNVEPWRDRRHRSSPGCGGCNGREFRRCRRQGSRRCHLNIGKLCSAASDGYILDPVPGLHPGRGGSTMVVFFGHQTIAALLYTSELIIPVQVRGRRIAGGKQRDTIQEQGYRCICHG